MGATNFYCEAVGKTVQEAFNRAIEDARHEYGHRSYTGSIAEKAGHGFRKANFPKRPTKKNFGDQVYELSDKSDKYGPALYHEFTGVMRTEACRRHGVKKGSRSKVFAFFGIASC